LISLQESNHGYTLVAAKQNKTLEIDSKDVPKLGGHQSKKVKHWKKVKAFDHITALSKNRARHVERRDRELAREKFERRRNRHKEKGIEDWGAPAYRKTNGRGRTPAQYRKANPPRAQIDPPRRPTVDPAVTQSSRKEQVLNRLNTLANQHAKNNVSASDSFEVVEGGSLEGTHVDEKYSNPYREAHAALTAHTNSTTHAAPVTMGKVFTQAAPHVSYGADGTVRIRHTELIDSVVALVTATVDDMTIHSYPINPGLSTYKWLSRIARGFHIWQMGRPWHARYISRVGTASVGGVIMAHQPDVEAPLPVTEQEITTLTGSKEFQPWLPEVEISIHPIDAPGGMKYVRSERKAGAPQLYDEGQLFVASLGVGVTAPATELLLGKLFVSYDVILAFPNGDPEARDYGASSTTVLLPIGPSAVVTQPALTRLAFANPGDAAFAPAGVNPLQVALTAGSGAGAYISLPTGYYSFDLTFLATISGGSVTESIFACFYDDKSATYLGESSINHIIHSSKVNQCRLFTSFWVEDSMLLLVHYRTSTTAGQIEGSSYAPAGVFGVCGSQVRITLL
jgi:protein-tyrosine-phosphatase